MPPILSLVSTKIASSLASKTSALDLAQSLGAAEHGDGTDDKDDRDRLEQVPAAVVHQEDEFHSEDGAEERSVRQRGGADSLAQVVRIRAKHDPLQTCG